MCMLQSPLHMHVHIYSTKLHYGDKQRKQDVWVARCEEKKDIRDIGSAAPRRNKIMKRALHNFSATRARGQFQHKRGQNKQR